MELKVSQKGRRSIKTTADELEKVLKKDFGILASNVVMNMILLQLKIHDTFELVNRESPANIIIKVIER